MHVSQFGNLAIPVSEWCSASQFPVCVVWLTAFGPKNSGVGRVFGADFDSGGLVK